MSLATGRYRLAASSVFFFTKTHDYAISSMARKIRIEMKAICSLKCASLLRSGNKNIQNISAGLQSGKNLLRWFPPFLSYYRRFYPDVSVMPDLPDSRGEVQAHVTIEE